MPVFSGICFLSVLSVARAGSPEGGRATGIFCLYLGDWGMEEKRGGLTQCLPNLPDQC